MLKEKQRIREFRRQPDTYKVIQWDGTLEGIQMIYEAFPSLDHLIDFEDGEMEWEIKTWGDMRDQRTPIEKGKYVQEMMHFNEFPIYFIVGEDCFRDHEEISADD